MDAKKIIKKSLKSRTVQTNLFNVLVAVVGLVVPELPAAAVAPINIALSLLSSYFRADQQQDMRGGDAN